MSGAYERLAVTPQEVERLHKRLEAEAESAGYHLNPDKEFTRGLVEGLIVNERRYGYWGCPCRLASGKKSEDLDIICPCDYRDADLAQYGACFCALYVSQDVVDGTRKATRVPERRPREMSADAETPAPADGLPDPTGLKHPIWRCKVCGYLCARDGPPEVCPICRAKKERFERFL
jgi:ferredoxin-thioredoxin reductase catalytic chain